MIQAASKIRKRAGRERCRAGQGKAGQGKACALAGGTLHLDRASQHPSDQVVDDVQPQPAAALTQASGEKRLKDTVQGGGRNADPIINIVQRKLHRADGAGLKADAASASCSVSRATGPSAFITARNTPSSRPGSGSGKSRYRYSLRRLLNCW